MAGRVVDGSVQLQSRCGGAPLLDHEINTPDPASHRGKIKNGEEVQQHFVATGPERNRRNGVPR